MAIIATGMDRGRMPGFQKKLGPDMVEQLASYVWTLSRKAPTDATQKGISAEVGSKSTRSEPLPPAGDVAAKVLPKLQPGNQVQPQEKKNAPLINETIKQAKLASPVGPRSKNRATTELVDLNSASKETLMTLPGITEADAINIIGGRPYKSTLQFKARKIVAPQTYARIADRVIAKQPARASTTGQPTHQ